MCDIAIVLENDYVRIELSKANALVKSVYDKTTQKEIKGEDAHFFSLFDENKNEFFPQSVDYIGGVFTVCTPLGEFKVKADVRDEYFVFELLSDLPQGAYKSHIAHIKYSYEYSKQNIGAAGVSMTWWANPCFFPDAKDKETNCKVLSRKAKGAKYALIIAPVEKHKSIIKEVCLAIDKNEGIVNPKGGVWSRECELNYGNIITDFDTTSDHLEKHIPYYKKLGVDIIDFHKNYFGTDPTFRQGDFKPLAYENDTEFKKNVCDVLGQNGMSACLHTYAYYVDYDCDTLLSNPKYQKDLKKVNEYTLSEVLLPDSDIMQIKEPLDTITSEHGFIMTTSPYLLIGEEIIKFEKNENCIKIIERGVAGTKAAEHNKGEKVYQICGRFGCLAPQMGSELFYEVARQTARAYDECGYEAIYIDALDGVAYACDKDEDEMAFYLAAFVCEVLKHCKTPPTLDYSIRRPCIWAGRSRVGNFDTPYRGYKEWNKFHAIKAKEFIDMYYSPSLGWYNFYGDNENEPGNMETKYQHTDAVEHLSSLSLMYNCSMTYVEFTPENYDGCAALRRNVEIYRKYDELRKKKYFTEDVLQKIRNGKYEYHLNDKNVFIEKDYQTAKLYDLCDRDRNSAVFSNPFKEQSPFVRIEALLSYDKTAVPKVILPVDKNIDVCVKMPKIDYGDIFDISGKYAKKVSVLGNGKKGALAIKLRSKAKGYLGYTEYIIETDFEGWRDFVLCESDKGERPDLPFDKEEWNYATYRFNFDHSKFVKAEVQTAGDVGGVKMTDVVAMPCAYETLKNPTLKVGDSTVIFNCELKSTDFIEFDGKTAKVIDRYGNENQISFSGGLAVPEGEFTASVEADNVNDGVLRAQLTFGFTGNEIR